MKERDLAPETCLTYAVEKALPPVVAEAFSVPIPAGADRVVVRVATRYRLEISFGLLSSTTKEAPNAADQLEDSP